MGAETTAGQQGVVQQCVNSELLCKAGDKGGGKSLWVLPPVKHAFEEATQASVPLS